MPTSAPFRFAITGRRALLGGVALSLLVAIVAAAPSHAAPAPFSLLGPGNAAYVADSEPVLSWNTTTSASPVVAYDVVIDGAYVGSVYPSACSTTCDAAAPDALADGAHTWSVIAVDDDTAETQSVTWSFVVDTHAPNVNTRSFGKLTPGNCGSYFVADDPSPTTLSYLVDGKAAASLCAIPDGSHAIMVSGTDAAGNTAAQTLILRADFTVPVVSITGPKRVVLGATSSFQATVAPDTAVGAVTYRWSNTAPFLFGPSTLGTSNAAFTWDMRSLWSGGSWWDGPGGGVTVTVTDAEGDVGTATLQVAIGKAAPAGPTGLRINDGAMYTNTKKVRITYVWPAGASRFVVTASDRPGFQTTPMNVTPRQTWQLIGSGKTGKPTMITARFNTDATYAAQITVDTVRPTFTKATLRGQMLSLKAGDKISGLAAIWSTSDRGKKGKRVGYRARIKDPGARWVRVQDRAGNFSPWVRIRRG